MTRLWLIFLSLLPFLSLADGPEPWQVGFQDPGTPFMQGLIHLHHDVLFFMALILVFVVWMMVRTVYHFHQERSPLPNKWIHGSAIEIGWTVAPTLILCLIAFPSFALLYDQDDLVDPEVTLKVTGRQWYWSYQYPDQPLYPLSFDSYMIPNDELPKGDQRNLEVDNRVVLPLNTPIRLLITSSDVLHSWAVPSLGIKVDAVPGRINEVTTTIQREGLFYGQCSELCGANHGFMPIVVEAVSPKEFLKWCTVGEVS